MIIFRKFKPVATPIIFDIKLEFVVYFQKPSNSDKQIAFLCHLLFCKCNNTYSCGSAAYLKCIHKQS